MINIELLEQQAINAAINAQWQNAISLNEEIISQDKENVDAYLRLGFAYLQINKIKEAKKYYNKALKLQPGNQIAFQHLERIKILETRTRAGHKAIKKGFSLDPNVFLEMPGKTKSVSLVNLGQKDILARLTIGQEVILKVKKRRIEIRTKSEEYIGSLPDDISKRLIIFIKAGSKYMAFIKEVNLNRIVVFLKEDRKGRKVLRYTSFPQRIQSRVGEFPPEEGKETEEEEVSENDLYKLAEDLTSEDKFYVPPFHEEEEEEEEE